MCVRGGGGGGRVQGGKVSWVTRFQCEILQIVGLSKDRNATVSLIFKGGGGLVGGGGYSYMGVQSGGGYYS